MKSGKGSSFSLNINRLKDDNMSTHNRHLQWSGARFSHDHRPKEYEAAYEKLHINQWHFFLVLFSEEEECDTYILTGSTECDT